VPAALLGSASWQTGAAAAEPAAGAAPPAESAAALLSVTVLPCAAASSDCPATL